MNMIEAVTNEEPPTGCRRFTDQEIHVAGQIAMSIVKAGMRGVTLHHFTTNCVNAYNLPGYPPNSEQRLQLFGVLLEAAKEIIRNDPPPPPNTWATMSHIIAYDTA